MLGNGFEQRNRGRTTAMLSRQEILNASILIVDDQPANVLLLEELLHDAGYTRMASTTDPYAVIELHRKNRYDLILLDLQMPGMDGFQVLEGLKTIETDGYLPVLVITAQPDHKLRALAAGAKDFVAKPFDLIEVQTRIHNMLEVRLLYQQLEDSNKVLEQTVLERTAELRASEARFRRLTELSADWYWEQDENGNFIRTFGPVFEMLGISIGSGAGKKEDGQETQGNKKERTEIEANLAARRPFLDVVYSRVKADGSRQYLMVSGEPIFDRSGRYTGYRGIGKDVTETMSPSGFLPPSH
jgi:PAS domain S-box-containing protein